LGLFILFLENNSQEYNWDCFVLFSVMGNNAGARNDGASPSRAKNFEDKHDHNMDLTQSGALNSHAQGVVLRPMVHCPPHNLTSYQPPFVVDPKVSFSIQF
jgi:hypothetical protein